jgi:putative PIN family toxin of toxin-antitoxin system
VERVVGLILPVSDVVGFDPLPAQVSRDRDDDNILATARAGESECIVTGDRDLLDLVSFEGIAIMRPGEFWEFEIRNKD